MKRTTLICYTTFDGRNNKSGEGYATVDFEGNFTGTFFEEKISQLTKDIQRQDTEVNYIIPTYIYLFEPEQSEGGSN